MEADCKASTPKWVFSKHVCTTQWVFCRPWGSVKLSVQSLKNDNRVISCRKPDRRLPASYAGEINGTLKVRGSGQVKWREAVYFHFLASWRWQTLGGLFLLQRSCLKRRASLKKSLGIHGCQKLLLCSLSHFIWLSLQCQQQQQTQLTQFAALCCLVPPRETRGKYK